MQMNIYEIFVTVTQKERKLRSGKASVKNRVTWPYLVAETTGHKAHMKTKRMFTQVFKGRHGVALSYSKPNCIISTR